MDAITLKNFRCFREEQTARLAPLTLLVGENSTGKTSFMAMIRALWDAACRYQAPDFKEEPYDLGSFDEIAHYRGARGSRADTFEAGFEVTPENYRFRAAFGKTGTTPIPVSWRHTRGSAWIEQYFESDRFPAIRLGTARGSWRPKTFIATEESIEGNRMRMPVFYPMSLPDPSGNDKVEESYEPLFGSPAFTSEDWDLLVRFDTSPYRFQFVGERPFAGAPVRSKPRRTYDPARTTPDPEGDYVPMYLADKAVLDAKTWERLKGQLERFGKAAGLFDEISIKRLGKRGSEPFQVQVRKFGDSLKGPRRNLIDVGYGVSQVLPVITELLRPDAPCIFLLQQPEVHLHPSAQAALGSLFCQTAAQDRAIDRRDAQRPPHRPRAHGSPRRRDRIETRGRVPFVLRAR